MLDAFTMAFLDCALWITCGDDDNPLNDTLSVEDIHPATLAGLVADCVRFQEATADLLSASEAGDAGHDFWLTRNGLGAGFWDGDWPAHGDKLTEAAKRFGEVNLYVGDDGRIYAMGYEPCPCPAEA